ncbi:hypothetical protein BHE74_00056365 [Ensete ventricosum]|nr:hypothetical protein BHE74_00056365 [Ensete ventricosum]
MYRSNRIPVRGPPTTERYHASPHVGTRRHLVFPDMHCVYHSIPGTVPYRDKLEVASDKEKTAAKQSPPYEVLLIRGPSQGSPAADISDSRAVASSLEGDTVRGSLSFFCFFFPRAASCNQANTTRYSPVSDGTGLKPQYRLLVGGLSIGLLSEPICTTYTGRYDSKLHILL